jgi:hypothetical protein
MKSLIFLFLFLLCSFGARAQTFTVKTGDGFNVQSGQPTNETFTLGSRVFPVLETAKGTRFIAAESKTGKLYPVWIHTKTEFTFEGKQVFKTKKGSFCIYRIGRGGYPYPVYLNKKD